MHCSKPAFALEAVIIVAAAFLGGCASAVVRQEDIKETCQVLVNEEFGEAQFQSNALSNK